MNLFAVTIQGVNPVACLTVFDSVESAQAMVQHFHDMRYSFLGQWPKVEPVESFFPPNMRNVNSFWIKAANDYLAGRHLNTSGEKE